MLEYLQTGAHVRAVKATARSSGGLGAYVKVYGYWIDTEMDDIPNWTRARILWEQKGRIVFGTPCEAFGDVIVGCDERARAADRDRDLHKHWWTRFSWYPSWQVAVTDLFTSLCLLWLMACVAYALRLGPLSPTVYTVAFLACHVSFHLVGSGAAADHGTTLYRNDWSSRGDYSVSSVVVSVFLFLLALVLLLMLPVASVAFVYGFGPWSPSVPVLSPLI
jgi:hypothetical protein